MSYNSDAISTVVVAVGDWRQTLATE